MLTTRRRFASERRFFCSFVAVFDTDGKVDLLFGRQERDAPDLFQINLDRVVDGNSFGAQSSFKVLVLLGRFVEIGSVDRFFAKVLHNLNALRLKVIIEFLDLLRLKVQFSERIQNFLCGELAFAFTLFNQFPDYRFLIRYRHTLSSYFFCCLNFSK
jgi:hypothetical protein